MHTAIAVYALVVTVTLMTAFNAAGNSLNSIEEYPQMEQERRPIGYWLKHLDRLIDQAFERALDADGLTRRHWQVLNTLAARPTTNAALTAALEPFVQGDSMAIEVVINDFLRRGWVRNVSDGGLEISEPGRAAHEAAMQRVAETRQALRRGISDDEYVNVIRILQRMASNLES